MSAYQLTVKYKSSLEPQLLTFSNKTKLEESYGSLKRMQSVEWVKLGDKTKPEAAQ